MTPKTFKEEIEKLKEVWPQVMTKGRIDLIWEIVNKESDEWFKKFCWKWVVDSTRGPTPADFSIEVRLREKSRELDALRWADQPDPRKNSIFTDGEIKEMFQFMKDAAKGKYSKKEVYDYCKMIDAACKAKGVPVQPWEHLHDETR